MTWKKRPANERAYERERRSESKRVGARTGAAAKSKKPKERAVNLMKLLLKLVKVENKDKKWGGKYNENGVKIAAKTKTKHE